MKLGRTENHSSIARTWQVSLECSHLVDYEGNGAVSSHRSWNCKLLGNCVLFLVQVGDSVCFKFLAVTCFSSTIKMMSSCALDECISTFCTHPIHV